ncbi:MmyB family transcriptional regulator [Nocardia niigatensis]|uniref:MmyB family transcriptional regulator n=1 Tax=Nocardia niigatensis TaxID=209249 RepID=UPI001FDF8CFD|nr:helix-turn-helix domain-containing protein [Nocardia niigatensis]
MEFDADPAALALPVPPTFGSVLRRLRDERGASRERLAFNAGVSASYVTHLEKGERDRPAREVVSALTRYLDRLSPLAPEEQRQLLDLAGLEPLEQPSMADLRTDLGRGIEHTLSLYEPHLAAYLDTRLNVLVANRSFDRAFPGLSDDVNLLRWMLGNPYAKAVLVEWEKELRIAIQWFNGSSAQNGEPAWSEDLLRELSSYPLFMEIWSKTTARYGGVRPLVRLRDHLTGRQTTVVGQLFSVYSTAYPGKLQIFIGLRS